MKLEPKRAYRRPAYPTKELFVFKPALFGRFLPCSWKGKKLVETALLSFILAGCSRKHISLQNALVPKEEEVREKDKNAKAAKTDSRIAKVAPLFMHGEGRGVSGCIVMNPPLFLSEAEARSVIMEELGKEGIHFDQINVGIEDIPIYKWRSCCFMGLEQCQDQAHLLLDAYSEDYNIGFEFISGSDRFDFGESIRSTVVQYNLPKIAEGVRDYLERYGLITAGVFYDPLVSGSAEEWLGWKEPREEKKEEAYSLLRDQVQDFIRWLKKENILNGAETEKD
jgi:hypothetical protein